MRSIVFGIDISDRSVELVSLFQKKGSVVVGEAGRAEIPPGVIERGVILDADALVGVIVRLLDAIYGTKRGKLSAGACLPASVVFGKVFALPGALEEEMVDKAVAIEASDVMPVPLQDVVADTLVLRRVGETQEVLHAVAQTAVAEAYRDVLVRAGIRPLFLDTEEMALVRALIGRKDVEPVLIADIGARSMNLIVADNSGLRFGSTVMFGSDRLTEALEKKLKLSLADAEKVKRAVGFDPGAADGRPFLIMQKPMGEIIAEISKTIGYYESKRGGKVKRIVLAGGAGLMPGVVEYVGSNFPGLQVVLGDPLAEIDAEGFVEEGRDRRQAILYATAIGLALRAVGAREGPGANLLPDAERSGRSGFAKIGQAFTSLLTMVTHGKKQPRKKKGEPEKEERVEKPLEPPAAPAPEQAPAEPSAPEPASEPAPAPPPRVGPTVAPASSVSDLIGGGPPVPEAEERSPAPAPAAAPSEAEEAAEPEDAKDYGHGIGDILAEEEATAEELAKEADLSGEPEPRPDSGERLSIEDILNRSLPAEKGRVVAKPKPKKHKEPRPASPGGGKGRIIGLALLVILLFLAATGGIMMFVIKNGLPKAPAFLTSLFTKKPQEQPAPAPAPGEQPAPAPAETPSSVSLTVLIGTGDAPGGDKPYLKTRMIETDVRATQKFQATGETTTTAGKACGVATIVNTTSRSYTFVVRTRLLSKEGVLFRMQAPSPIPANGEVNVNVCADEPGPEGDIGPSTFTIPGLPPDLQKVITAKSSAPMTGGSGKAKAVSQGDIDAAKETLLAKLKAEALDNFGAMVSQGEDLVEELVTSKELGLTAPKAGTAASTFDVTLSVRFNALLVPEKDLDPLLAKELEKAVPPGKTIADVSLGTHQFTVLAYDTAARMAEVRIEAPVIGQ